MGVDYKSFLARSLLPNGRKEIAAHVYNEIMLTNAATHVSSTATGDALQYIGGICNYIVKLLPADVFKPCSTTFEPLEYAGVKDMVFKCWDSGIPVFFLQGLPKTLKFEWVVTGSVPCIFLNAGITSSAWLSLYLLRAFAYLHHKPDGWVESLLFENGVTMVPTSVEKLLLDAANFGSLAGTSVALASESWDKKYRVLAQTVINKLSDPFPTLDISSMIYEQYIVPSLQQVSLPVHFFLQQCLSASEFKHKREIEQNILLTRIDMLADAELLTETQTFSYSILLNTKLIAECLNCLPLSVKFSDWHVSLVLPSKEFVEVRIYESDVIEFTVGSELGLFFLKGIDDIYASPLLPFLVPYTKET